MSSEKSTLSDELSRLEAQSKGTDTNVSMISMMEPIPSEVAANFKKGLYSTAGEDYGSSVFEHWGEGEDGSSGLRSKSMTWRRKDRVTEKMVCLHSKKALSKRRRHSDVGGLFSCFGRGFELAFVCGPSSIKKNRKKLHPYHHHHQF